MASVVAPCGPWFTADQFSLCEPGDVRPDIMEAAVRAAEAILFVKTQRIYTGTCTDTWYPDLCGQRCRPPHCMCAFHPSFKLRRGPVASITSVTIDGVVLDPAAYRLGDPDDAMAEGRLFRIDGEGWPCCNDIADQPDGVGSWSVVYPWGQAPPPGSLAMGQALACEFVRAWTPGAKCRLPRHVTSVTRENVTQSILADKAQLIANGSTGLDEVDMWLVALNPSGADREPRVLTPEALGLGHDPTNRAAARQRSSWR